MSRRTEAALQETIDLLVNRIAIQDTQIEVLVEQNQRLIAAALAASANPAGAAIVRVRPASADEPKAPIQHAVGL
jgi:hypothetical protein